MIGFRPSDLRWHVIPAAVGFFIAIVTWAPAGLAAWAIKRVAPLTSFAGAEGTLWNGRLRGVSYSDVSIGDIDFRLRASGLLLLRATIDMKSANGALEGASRVHFQPGAVEFRELSATFNLGAIRRYSFFGVPYQGAASVTADRIRLTRTGCEAEKAAITTSAFEAFARRWSGDAFPMSGAIDCRGGALLVSLSGAGDDGTAELTVSVRPDFSYALTVAARPRKADVSRALEFFGFENRGDGLSYNAVGVLKGLSS